MLKSKLSRKITASVAALVMVATSVGATMPVFAGQQLGETNFDKGAGLPWHICESGTADMDFTIDNGTYNITINNPGGASRGGEDRWDCQFRHRGLYMDAGHTYTLTYQIKSDTAGKYYTKIGNLDATTVGAANAGETWHNNGTVTIQSDKRGTIKNNQNVSYGEGWNLQDIQAGETLTVTAKFQPQATLETAEWTFHFGGNGQYGNGSGQDCFPEGTKLTFDNMSLIDETSNEHDWPKTDPYERNEVLANQVGYVVGAEKKATVVVAEGDSAAKDFNVVDESGKVVYTGKTSGYKADPDSGDCIQIADFSDFDIPGTYYVQCDGVKKPTDYITKTASTDYNKSYTFTIGTGDEVYSSQLIADSLNYFYQNRSGIAIEDKYITTEEEAGTPSLARAAGHTTDTAYIQTKWVDSYKLDGSDIETSNGKQDITGGWYDAGDHGKYVVNGGVSVWTLQNIYERALAQGTEAQYADGTMKIPEAGNKYPDILDEARYEMEFMLKMVVQSGTYKGMVYHKIHDYKWTGLAVKPEDDALERIIKPATYAASLNLAACGAQAYRLWKDIDPTFANKCLAAAKTAYTASQTNYKPYDTSKANTDAANVLYAPLDQAKGGGPYGDTEVLDDFYWAASELYVATGDSTYYSDMKSKYSNYFLKVATSLKGGENSASCSSFNWGCTASMGTLSLYLNADKLTTADATTVETSIVDAAKYFNGVQDSQGYGISYKPTSFTLTTNGGGTYEGYEWGSNSFVINNCMVQAYAADVEQSKGNTDDADIYASGATEGMDYILGRNPMDYSYVTGYGSRTTENPHHRYWSYIVNKDFPKAPNGVLSGGPNSAMQDPWIQGAGYKVGQRAPQLCYLDHVEAWSVNECTINWNAPLAWMATYLNDYEFDGSVNPETTTTTTETTTTTTTTTAKETTTTTATTTTSGDTKVTMYGDVNLDGRVTVADVILINKYMAGMATLSAQQLANGDVTGDGKVNNIDGLKIMKLIGGLISTLDPKA